MEFIFENGNSQRNTRSARSSSSRAFGQSQSVNTFDHSGKKTRRNIPHAVDDIEISGGRSRRTRRASVPARIKSIQTTRRTSSFRKEFNWTWNKLGWMVCAALFLRLIFMESGVIDYYEMEASLVENQYQLQLIEDDNVAVVSEIHKIKTSPRYQRKIVRTHLGVIAQDEYLILFSKDS